jgi:four helix bundle protein
MDERAFKERTRDIALRVVRLCEALPKGWIAQTVGKQLLRSGTSIGANYRAACRGKSAPDMIAKLGIVEEEADETLYWIDLLVAAKLLPAARVSELEKDIGEILAMVVSSIKTLRTRQMAIQNPKSKIQNR